jgi:hypothetical protein
MNIGSACYSLAWSQYRPTMVVRRHKVTQRAFPLSHLISLLGKYKESILAINSTFQTGQVSARIVSISEKKKQYFVV